MCVCVCVLFFFEWDPSWRFSSRRPRLDMRLVVDRHHRCNTKHKPDASNLLWDLRCTSNCIIFESEHSPWISDDNHRVAAMAAAALDIRDTNEGR
jgi:hypothetical protein